MKKNAVGRARIDPELAKLQALKRQAPKRDRRVANSAGVSGGEMLLLRPERMRGAKVRWPKASLL